MNTLSFYAPLGVQSPCPPAGKNSAVLGASCANDGQLAGTRYAVFNLTRQILCCDAFGVAISYPSMPIARRVASRFCVRFAMEFVVVIL